MFSDYCRTAKMNYQSGVVLLEAMIAILLFSLGILALVGLQGAMTKGVTQSKLRGEASVLIEQLLGQMWVDQASLANYAVAAGACTNSYANCTNWLASVRSFLPSGSAVVAINGAVVTITLTWQLPGEAPSQLQVDANVTS